jgi:hypothetical protein
LVKNKQKEKDQLKGDKLRDLIFLVHLNNKYGKGKNDISELKRVLSYSTGGIYSALDSSGYFERTPTEIKLTDKGQKYLKNRVLPPYETLKTVGYAILFLGAILTLQWVDYTYFNQYLVFPWYSNLSFIFLGTFMIFFILRMKYYLAKRRMSKLSDT